MDPDVTWIPTQPSPEAVVHSFTQACVHEPLNMIAFSLDTQPDANTKTFAGKLCFELLFKMSILGMLFIQSNDRLTMTERTQVDTGSRRLSPISYQAMTTLYERIMSGQWQWLNTSYKGWVRWQIYILQSVPSCMYFMLQGHANDCPWLTRRLWTRVLSRSEILPPVNSYYMIVNAWEKNQFLVTGFLLIPPTVSTFFYLCYLALPFIDLI